MLGATQMIIYDETLLILQWENLLFTTAQQQYSDKCACNKKNQTRTQSQHKYSNQSKKK